MTVSFQSSLEKTGHGAGKYRKQAKKALKGFSASLFAAGAAGESSLRDSKALAGKIRASGEKIFICAFGGSISPAKILKSFFPLKSPSVAIIDIIQEGVLEELRSLSKKSLQSSHWVFISKSGSAPEILFYINFLRALYREKKLPLKGRLSALTARSKSPLADWTSKEKGAVFFSRSPLPGRFSFFAFSGLLQSWLCGLKPAGFEAVSKRSAKASLMAEKALAFILSQMDGGRGGGFFCSPDSKAAALGDWWQKAWSESLFKKGASMPPAPLRQCSLSDLRHAFLEELIAGEGKYWLWSISERQSGSISEHQSGGISEHQSGSISEPSAGGLQKGCPSLKSFRDRQQKALRSLLAKQNRPCMSFALANWEMPSVENLIFILFQILYGAGNWIGSDIYSQPWVDCYKGKAGPNGV